MFYPFPTPSLVTGPFTGIPWELMHTKFQALLQTWWIRTSAAGTYYKQFCCMLSFFTHMGFLVVLQTDHVLCNLKTIKLNYLCLECSSSFFLNFPLKYQLLKMNDQCRGWCVSVDWVLAWEPKCCWFDSQWGHMPGLRPRSPVGGVREATTHWCFFHSLSPCLPLSLKINK